LLKNLSQATISHGKQVEPNNYHITTCFIGQTDTNQRTAIASFIQAALLEFSLEPFTLDLNRIEYWPKPNIVAATPTLVPNALKTLHQISVDAAKHAGFLLERTDRLYGNLYQPHVTLARKVPKTMANVYHKRPFTALSLNINALHLYESRSTTHGVQYQIIESFTLG
jgi:2'-5' RNA ligase